MSYSTREVALTAREVALNSAPPLTKRPRPVVFDHMDQLSKLLLVHTELIATLEDRLSPILRREPATPVQDKAIAVPSVPLAELISETVVQLDQLAYRLNSLINRVEV